MAAAPSCPVVDGVRRAAFADPSRTAVVAGGHRVTYAQLWDEVLGWQQRFGRLGLAERSLIALISADGGDLPAAFLGASAAGMVPMLVDDLLPQARIETLLHLARPAAVVSLAQQAIAVLDRPDRRRLAEGAGYVVFSSGSQGAPKGIAGQAAGLSHFIEWEVDLLGLAPGTRTAMLTSPSFDVVFRDFLLPLFAGAELHIAPQKVRASPRLVLPWLAEHRVNLVHAVPSLSARWLSTAAQQRVDSLHWTLFAGEPLYAQHVERWRAAAPQTGVFNLYGPSETTLAKFCYRVPPIPKPGLQPVGRPLPGTTVGFVAHEDGVQVVTIETPFGSLGYLDDTCSADDRLRLRRESGVTQFRTQDRGQVDDSGNLVIVGRTDSLVKRNGTFVDQARIELAAAELPEVKAACCLQLLPSGRIILAVEGPDSAMVAQLRRRLRPTLGNEIPDEVVLLASLPLLPGGKVDRRAVKDLLREVDDDAASNESKHSHLQMAAGTHPGDA